MLFPTQAELFEVGNKLKVETEMLNYQNLLKNLCRKEMGAANLKFKPPSMEPAKLSKFAWYSGAEDAPAFPALPVATSMQNPTPKLLLNQCLSVSGSSLCC